MAVTIASPLTPYITPQILTAAPTGISWPTIPYPKSTASEQSAEQMNICQRATAMTETACNSVLRATVDSETFYGPDFRTTINASTGVARIEMSRWPVTQCLGGSVSFPFSTTSTTIPAAAIIPQRPPLGIYGTSAPSNAADGGQAVLVAPGYISWQNGRAGFQIVIQYIAGWPHTSLTATVAPGANTISVDDCTGWGPVTTGGQGAAGLFYDGNDQEANACTAATAQSGPGILTLQSPVTFGHGPGVLFSAMPAQVIQATILYATAEALVRGATATVIQSVAGMGAATAAGHYELMQVAREMLIPFKRVV